MQDIQLDDNVKEMYEIIEIDGDTCVEITKGDFAGVIFQFEQHVDMAIEDDGSHKELYLEYENGPFDKSPGLINIYYENYKQDYVSVRCGFLLMYEPYDEMIKENKIEFSKLITQIMVFLVVDLSKKIVEEREGN